MHKRFNKPILRDLFKYVYTRKSNCLVGITGSVNTGKSHCSVNLGWKFDPNRFKIEESLVYSVEQLIEKSLSYIKYKKKPLDFDFVKDIDNIREWLKENMDDIHISPGKVIIMDETGALGAYVRDFFSMDNKSLAKILQIWRILRMLCIFVVPEDMKLAESTISRFLNIEVRMLRIASDNSNATCIAWEYRGWNKKTKEPIKYRLKGCRYKGLIHIPPLPAELQKKYEDHSRSAKIAALIDMGKEYRVNKPQRVAATKSIYDDIKYVKSHIEDFKNDRNRLTAGLIQSKLGTSYHRAQQIRQNIMQEPKTHA